MRNQTSESEDIAGQEIYVVDMAKEELLVAIRHDCVAFLSFYLQDQLTMAVPDFHEEIWDELLQMIRRANLPGARFKLKKLFAVPREHAKSTLAKLAVILFLKYSPLKFVMYVSKTVGVSKNAIRDIMSWLKSEQERELFGPIRIVKSSETEALWIIDIYTRDSANEKPRLKRCIFKALGADTQVRGTLIENQRPQIIIIDDIEDLDNTTKEQQPKLDTWLMGSLMKSFDSRRHVVIFIGNMITSGSILARFSKDPEWNPVVFGSIVRNKDDGALRALWPELHSVESLLADYAAYRRLGTGHVWEAEMMNLTMDEIIAADFKNTVRFPLPDVDELTCGMLILDPAFGKHGYNDFSAITVHARIEGLGIPCIIDSWEGKVTEEEMLDQLLSMSYRWGITTWCIEAEAAQKLLIPLFKLLMKDRQMAENLIDMVPITSNKTNKASKITAFRSIVGGGSYAICEEQEALLQRLIKYSATSSGKDDLEDSASYGPLAWATHGEIVNLGGIKKTLYHTILSTFDGDADDSAYTGEIETCGI